MQKSNKHFSTERQLLLERVVATDGCADTVELRWRRFFEFPALVGAVKGIGMLGGGNGLNKKKRLKFE